MLKHYWLESYHGVIVDVVNTLSLAKKILREKSPFRSVPLRAFYNENGKKIYIKDIYHD